MANEIGFPKVILAEAGLSSLGLGIQPPPSWGYMLKEAQQFLCLVPSYAVFLGVVLAMAVLSCNLLGDGWLPRQIRSLVQQSLHPVKHIGEPDRNRVNEPAEGLPSVSL
jgi:ABC-type antimicrobial peptide transport system permease subunit